MKLLLEQAEISAIEVSVPLRGIGDETILLEQAEISEETRFRPLAGNR